MLIVDSTSAWQRLCELLDPDPELWPQVREALEEEGGDPWEALLGALDDAGALASLRSDDTGMELADALAQLPRVFQIQPDLSAVNDTDELEDALALADETLADDGHRLIALPEDEDDGYALVVVPGDAVAEIIRLAAGLGRTVGVFG